MKRLLKKIFLMSLILVLLACNKQTDTNDENKDTRIIVDALGREVEIPAKVEKIVPLGNTPRMITYLGLADNVVGIGECEISSSPIQAYAYINKEKWEQLPNCGTDAMGETAYYPEEIILSNPDVILCTYTEDVTNDIQNQTGIPTISVKQGTLFGEDYEESLRILGEVCNVEERSEEVIAFINENLNDVRNRVKNVPDENKARVLAAAATFKGGHSIDGIYTNYSVFEVLSANDVAREIADNQGEMGVMVDKEQILLWDPDIIFFDSQNVPLVKNDYKENPEFFNELAAVKNGQLYQWPNSTWHWTNVEIPLVSTYHTGKLLYPDEFSDINFDKKASEIFEFFLGEANYLENLEDYGASYTTVNLED